MDREQEKFRSLGFFGIFKEAFNITSSHKKIFTRITLSLILPLSFIYVSQNEIIGFVLGENEISPQNDTDDTRMEIEKYYNTPDFSSPVGFAYWLLKIGFFGFWILLSLVSTSAVVYTIACIYSAKEIRYDKVMKVVPKVWNGLLLTFLWNLSIFCTLISWLILIILLTVTFLVISTSGVLTIILSIIGGMFFLGLVYLSFVWQVANVISVLEDVHGIPAMVKSKNLIKGKTGICASVVIVLNLCYLGIYLGFKASVVPGESVLGKILHACLWSMLMSVLSLFGLVIQTIIYFICKSYHGENINKSSLANHLEVYSKDYAGLDAQEVSMVQIPED